MTREDPIIRVRLPEELRVALKKASALNRRTMNAEIVSRLETSIDGNDLGADEAEADRRSKQAVRRLDEILMSDHLEPATERLKALEEKVSKLEAALKMHGIET